MPILVVGSVAFDSIKTPSGSVERCVGGAATYFSLAASYFTDVQILAVVGDDFTAEHESIMVKRGVDITAIQRKPGKTFFWSGEYAENLNEAKSLDTQLNVFADFDPVVPGRFQETPYLFLANIQPALQLSVRNQMKDVQLTGADTMNYWINGYRSELEKTLQKVDILLINDTETRMLGGSSSLTRAAQNVLKLGPTALVVKHGEFGATAFFRADGMHPFRAPALPIEEVVDPTGAGDCFAGGFMGYIASQPEMNREVLKRAMFYGGVMGSFACEKFGTERFQTLTRRDIDSRFEVFRELSHLE